MSYSITAACKAALLVCSLLVLVACSNSAHVPVVESGRAHTSPVHTGPIPQRYVVQKGDTLYDVAFRYNLDYRKLGGANGIKPPYRIFPGDILQLRETAASRPSTQKKTVAKSTSPTPAKKASPKKQPQPAVRYTPKVTDGGLWQWPLSGKIERYFSGDGLSKGIDIVAAIGTPVRSARAGQGIYGGSRLKGYGQLIIIRHDDIYLSAYAHNRVIKVQEGQNVKQGDVIAELGMSGTQSPKLHFEIRKSGKPINPLDLLPK